MSGTHAYKMSHCSHQQIFSSSESLQKASLSFVTYTWKCTPVFPEMHVELEAKHYFVNWIISYIFRKFNALWLTAKFYCKLLRDVLQIIRNDNIPIEILVTYLV